ncbi:peptidoglycan-binding protein [Paraburkholderia sediminicola]|uniref:peptidoglycan-binding domain-containing protein n=1 Tax=Paraburkholderia sediminicola TaxID=458836 RepID=UPI0038BB71AC
MILVRPGERGPRVALIQILLNRAGESLTVDGMFGPTTRASVHGFQISHGIVPADSIVGPKTWQRFPLGDNTRVVDVVDVADPGVGVPAVAQLRKAGGNPIQLGLMCAGVEQMVNDVIAQADSRGSIALLRITGHGNLGQWMTVSVGDVVDLPPDDYKVWTTEYHSYIDWGHIHKLAPILSPLKGYFAPYGMMEHGGCSLGSRSQTRNLMSSLADLWEVPVSVGVGIQTSILNFDGSTYTAYPQHGTLNSWSKKFREASY